MNRHATLLLTAALAFPGWPEFASAQTKRYPPSGQGVDARPGNRRDERGTVEGEVVWVRAKSNSPTAKKEATLAVKPNGRPQVTLVLVDDTSYAIEGLNWPAEKIKVHLNPGTPVILNWEYWDRVDGRVVKDLKLRTVSINGTIRSARANKLQVEAIPKEPDPEPEPISVRGRRQPPDEDTRKKEPAKPRKLTLPMDPATTHVTLNGKDSNVKALAAKMEFDAIVLNGGLNTVLELNARSNGRPDVRESEVKRSTKKPKDAGAGREMESGGGV